MRIKGHIIRLPLGKQIYLFGIGKASAKMVKVAREVIGEKVAGGLCIVPEGLAEEIPDIEVFETSYPIPDERSIAVTQKLIEMVSNKGPADLLLFFISGGGSPALVAPPKGVSLKDIQQLNKILYSSGLTIAEINTIRRHVSLIGGGGVLRFARDARVVTVLLSNILSDNPSDIASGPTVPDKTNFCDAAAIIFLKGLKHKVPASIMRHIKLGAFGLRTDTFKKILVHERYRDPILLGNNLMVRKIAVDFVTSYGMKVHEIDIPLAGDAAALGRAFSHVLVDVYDEYKSELPICVVASGRFELSYGIDYKQTGRCQEFALAAALAGLKDLPQSVLLAGNTGGEDSGFQSKFTGAIVTSKTAEELKNRNLDPVKALKENKVTSLLEEIGATFKNGKFYGNLLDIVIAIIAKD